MAAIVRLPVKQSIGILRSSIMMDIRAILLDFDGTSLQRDQVYISFRNKRALLDALDRGVEIIPCTGRCEDMFPPQIEAEKRIRYWVTANGARVVNRQKKEVIFQSLFTPEESAMLCRIFEGRHIYSEISADGKIFMERDVCAHLENYPVPPHHVWFLEAGRQIEVDTPSAYFLEHGIGVEKVNVYGVPAEQQQPMIRALLDTGIVTITDGAGADIQFFPKRQRRVDAMDALFSRLGYGYESVMSLGDSRLDQPMIENAAIGVAMGNAPEQVKAVADYVTAPFDHDGVADAIEKYLL